MLVLLQRPAFRVTALLRRSNGVSLLGFDNPFLVWTSMLFPRADVCATLLVGFDDVKDDISVGQLCDGVAIDDPRSLWVVWIERLRLNF